MSEHVKAKREAGAITRWHVLPHIGVDTVANHSWNATMLLLELNPGASRALIVYVLNHDVAERWTGDVPTFCKRLFPAVHKGLKEAERHIEDQLELPSVLRLTDNERHWAEAVDALESALWCSEQRLMGNRMVDDTLKYLNNIIFNSDWVPAAVQVFYLDYESERTTDYISRGVPYEPVHE